MKIFTYLFILLFSIGSLQAGTHYCVNMGTSENLPKDMPEAMPEAMQGAMQDTSMSDDQSFCHIPSQELAKQEPANDDQSNSCCDNDCGSCVSVGFTFNSSMNNLEFAYINNYKQYGSFFILSNHIEIPTPPPNC